MEITRGKQSKGVKFVVYGPEGIGKSTFVSKIPGIVFIDTEGSTGEMDVLRLPTPTTWAMYMETIDWVIANPGQVKALVTDTADWAERLCIDYVCQTHMINGKPMSSIEDAGYGKGYVYLYEEFGKALNKLEQLSQMGIHVGFTAHAMMRKFEQPDEMGAYDRWEMKMTKKVAPLIKEWASIMLFANYKTMVYATDDKGKKHKAAGGQRVMYANHHPCWDAKNRYGLPDEMPFDFSAIAHIFEGIEINQAATNAQAKPKQSIDEVLGDVPPLANIPENKTKSAESKVSVADKLPDLSKPAVDYTGIPEKLADLMKNDDITPFEVKAAVAQRGYFPMETPWECYPADFVNGVLIGAWGQVKAMVLENRQNAPF